MSADDDFERRLTPRQRRMRSWGIAHPLRMATLVGLVAGLYGWSLFEDVRGAMACAVFSTGVIYALKRRDVK